MICGYVTIFATGRGTTSSSSSVSPARTILYGTINDVLRDVYSSVPADGLPRVVAVDWQPDTAALRNLIKTGLGNQAPAPGAVTQIESSSGTTTAALLILLAKALELKLSQYGVTVPSDIDAQLAAFTLSAPAMLRWSYLLRPPTDNQYVQKVNLQQAAERGYVPVALDPDTTARALRTRSELRAALGLATTETTGEVIDGDGFLTYRGCAYLPVGLGHDELVASCRPGGPIDHARQSLPHPTHLECVLVSDDPGSRSGVHIETGREVAVP